MRSGENKWKAREVASEIRYGVCYLVAITSVVLITVVVANFMLNKSTVQRVFHDLNTKAEMHMTMIEAEIERQFTQLRVIESIWDSGEKSGDNLDAMWHMLEGTEEFTSIGFADLSGNAVDYTGEEIGNISHRSYFYDIVNGTVQGECVYLESTLTSSDPKLVLSVPFYSDGEMIGVLFKSKDVSEIEESIIEDTHFNGQAGMFIVDAQGNILMISGNEDLCLLSDNIFDSDNHMSFEDVTVGEVQNNLIEMVPGKCTLNHEHEEKYAVYTPIRDSNWTLFCMVDKKVAITNYAERTQFVERTILLITMMFGFCVVFSVVVMVLYIRDRKNAAENHRLQYIAYKRVMYELSCPVYEYDVKNDRIVGNERFQEEYYDGVIEGFAARVEEWKESHPEYNFDGMLAEIRDVMESKKISCFESFFRNQDGTPRWNKSVLIPVCDSKDEMLSVFVTIMDNTQDHAEFENTLEMMSSTCIGLHRCYLSEPIHVEYVSQGIRRMLGYTEEELNTLLGREQDYANLLTEEDREAFHAFARRMSQEGGIDTCEYRMVCKDGSLLTVSDTMEVKIGSDGVKYGYAVVTDISKYQELHENDKIKLEELEIKLNEARLKVSTGQMQPHFLYNALASIREIVLDDPEYASDLIFDFTTHLRACIKSMSSEAQILFSQEIENIKAYVNIEKMRFGDKLQVKYNIEESDFYIIPLSVQPLVENAIRHGIYERGDVGGTVEISSYREGHRVIIQVEDNGVGFDVESTKQEVYSQKRDSAGLQNLIFRFEKIMGATVGVESKLGVGTRITVSIPIRGEEKRESNHCR